MIFCAFAVKVFFQTPSELIFVPESKSCGIIHFDHFRPTERVPLTVEIFWMTGGMYVLRLFLDSKFPPLIIFKAKVIGFY